MLPPLSWEPLSLRKQPRKWFQNPLKDLESKWFLLFSKSTLIFKRFTKSKSENNFVSKGVENSFSKSKSFQKVLISKLARISTRIPKVFATHPSSLIKPIFKNRMFWKVVEKPWVFVKWFQTMCNRCFKTSFPKSLFEKVSKKNWLLKLPLPKTPNVSKIILKRDLESKENHLWEFCFELQKPKWVTT